MSALPPLPIVVPMFGAALLAALRKWTSRPAADTLTILFAAINVTTCSLLLRSSMHEPIVYWLGNWFPRGSMVLGVGLYIDPIGAGFALLASTLTLLAAIFSWKYVDEGNGHAQPLIMIFLAAMCGFSLTGDLFNMFVFFELMSVAAFALCGLDSREPAPLQGAFNFAVTNTVAAFMVLTGIALLYSVTGALNMAQIGLALGDRHDTTVLFACALIFCGFFIKAAIVPFHFWLADAHAVAPTPVCVLFSGLMVELGLYAVLRLRIVVFGSTFHVHEATLRALLLAAAALTVLVGGFMCYAEHHLKRMLAFSTISHAGLMLLGIAFANPLAIAGMFLYVLAHALVKSTLFFTAGLVLHRLRTVSEKLLFGKGVGLWPLALLWFCGGLGLAGFPLFLTTRGDSFLEAGAHHAGVSWLPLLFVLSGLLTAAAVFRTGMHTFFRLGSEPLTDEAAGVDERPDMGPDDKTIRFYHYLPPYLCITAAIVFTFVPALHHHVLRWGTQASDQSYMLAKVYNMPHMMPEAPAPPTDHTPELTGILAACLALLLALTSVFRLKLPRAVRLGAYLEEGFRPLRMLHSGYAPDYVTWITTGVAVFGAALFYTLR